MEEHNGDGANRNDERWTCEACGCNTNQASDRSCSICGTSSSGPSIVRRHGAASFAARFIAGSLRHGDVDLDDVDVWESVTNEVARSQDLPVQHGEDAPDAEAIMEEAKTTDYRPFWTDPSHLGTSAGRRQGKNEIQICDGERGNIAILPAGAAEGRVVRANDCLPRLARSGESSHPVGFRVAFDHPSAESGGNMGGCHLIGIVTSSFNAYHDPNGLQQSPYFWGIEDSGQKYDGSQMSRNRRRALMGGRGGEYVSPEAPLNDSNVLFGSKEVVSVICDFETRSLTMWRNDVLLGTIVSNLPRNGNLYPVAVPFNSGTAVAITSLRDDPLPLLRSFATDCLKNREDRQQEQRERVAQRRATFVQEGKPTNVLNRALNAIFKLYSPGDGHDEYTSYQSANRLWHRCGLRLSSLDEVSKKRRGHLDPVSYIDFYETVCNVIEASESLSCSDGCFVKDDIVELVDNAEKYGDSVGGPLSQGDRGRVVDLQKGPNDDIRSVRVFHNGRRWWYQPQAIVTERSGLIDSPAIWFVCAILRAHGFDDETGECMHGKLLSDVSWKAGDIVTPSSGSNKVRSFGRVVQQTTAQRGAGSDRSSSVLVEFVDDEFASTAGVKLSSTTSETNTSHPYLRRIKASSLCLWHPPCCLDAQVTTEGEQTVAEPRTTSISGKLQADITSLSSCELGPMDSVLKACKKNQDLLPSMFSSGLPDALLSALDIVAKQLNSLEQREDLCDKISVIGNLVKLTAEFLFQTSSSDDGSCSLGEMESMEIGDDEGPNRVADDVMSSDRIERASNLRRLGLRVSGLNQDDASSELGMANVPQLLNASLQQRRGMLLSLLSRGGRRNGLSFGDHGGTTDEANPFSSLFLSPTLHQGEDSTQNSPWDAPSNIDDSGVVGQALRTSTSALDALRRRGGYAEDVAPSLRQGGPSFFNFVQELVSQAILTNDTRWATAILEGYCAKKSASSSRSASSLLRNGVDEDGTKLLQLAILVGCDTKLVQFLVSHGAAVCSDNVKLAVATNHHEVLSVLLQHTTFNESEISLTGCSTLVREVVSHAQARQAKLDREMRDAAGEFLACVGHKLVSLSLSARKNLSVRAKLCAKALCTILVGDVLLGAMHRAQSTDSNNTVKNDTGGRCAKTIGQVGLLQCLPSSVFAQSVFPDIERANTYFALLEEYLCSKDLTDIAAGLSMCSVMLRNCPQIKQSGLLLQYGLANIISFHQTFSSSKIKLLNQAAKAETIDESKLLASPSCSRIIKCPKNHVASIHVTRHSSFRCDICGSGVERGRPMHGCRECDWDACEECTDKSESGAVKFSTLNSLARQCLQDMELDECSNPTCEWQYWDTVDKMSQKTETSALEKIASRLLNRDTFALRELANMLRKPGRVTFHQFVTIALPALHESLTGIASDKDTGVLAAQSSHKKKKPRVGCSDDFVAFSTDDRFAFARDSVIYLMDESSAKPVASLVPDILENSKPVSAPYAGVELDEIAYSSAGSEILRRLHQALSLYEDVEVCRRVQSLRTLSNGNDDGRDGSLSALTKPITIHLKTKERTLAINVQPLATFKQVETAVIRSAVIDGANYRHYCTRIARDSVFVVEKDTKATSWRLARVTAYSERTGAHSLLYVTGHSAKESILDMSSVDDSAFTFDAKQVDIVLALRDYVIIHRSNQAQDVKPTRKSPRDARSLSGQAQKYSRALGSRVQSSCGGDWDVYTLLDATVDKTSGDTFLSLVSESGEVFSKVPPSKVRVDLALLGNDSDAKPIRDSMQSHFRFRSSGNEDKCTVKRSWSAIALTDSMKAADILNQRTRNSNDMDRPKSKWNCIMKGTSVIVACSKQTDIERPPDIRVQVATDDSSKPETVSDPGAISVFQALHLFQGKSYEESVPLSGDLYVSVSVSSSTELTDDLDSTTDKASLETKGDWSGRPQHRARTVSSRSLSPDGDTMRQCSCRGLDTLSQQCMEIIGVLSMHASDTSETVDNDSPKLIGFANQSLSRRLLDQLNVPLRVVAGLLPSWCTSAPIFAPRCFTYQARKCLLQRTAFGVSRSTLEQQNAKINVARLKQRMGALRARAVELMGEAFSGGAEDPTALQLQADELYGMEETLASRIRASFRAANWQEHSLQVVKAAVSRRQLLEDAFSIMNDYAHDMNINKRRLEVRFEGESGFDAASGDEAGVTRGFYADVAESLLSSTLVASVVPPTECRSHTLVQEVETMDTVSITGGDEQVECKLPLWIPDFDSTSQVMLPAPRADARSSLGIYPRPIPTYHPQFHLIIQQFRFMGRVFAAAMRDDFKFPLPLSSSFLKLVQHAKDSESSIHSTGAEDMVLTVYDLPRPGFLGGDVYAAHKYICHALNQADSEDPCLSHVELQRRYQSIASDKSFGRTAFGFNYDCSFEDYYQYKTFVDPLDPGQGEDAVPLCARGHTKTVTIYNVREWVGLAKSFMLHDGVVAQALAFRYGINDFFSYEYIRLFTADELQRDVCGSVDSVDAWDESTIRKLFKLNGGKGAAEALVAVAAIGGEGGAAMSRRFSPSSPTIMFLVKALLEADANLRRQFLTFVTSVPIVTPGKIEVVPIVSPSGEFLPVNDPSCLPRANTCARRLYLPKFDDFDNFAEVLWAVVREESRFKGFYEWRGSS